MPDEEIMAWLRANEATGYSFEQLKDILLKKGYKEYAVNEALIAILDQKLPVTEYSLRKKKKSRVGLIIGLTIAALVLLFLIWVLIP